MRNFEKENKKPLKVKKCKNCLCAFQPFNPLQYICCPSCAVIYNKKLEAKKIDVKVKEMKDGLKGLKEYKKDLEVEINTIVRLIDKGCDCISCNSKGNSAGHFHSVAANGSIRYNLHNLHLQEYSCNGEKGGNVIKYGAGLIYVYGKEYKEYVEYDLVRLYPEIKLSLHEIKEAIKKARNVVKILKVEDKEYSPKERLQKRNFFNKVIGIYKF